MFETRQFDTAEYVGSEMMKRRWLLFALAALASLAVVFFLGSMLAQAMLGGASAAEASWDRFVVWLIYFPAAGLSAMAAVYLIQRALRREDALRAGSAAVPSTTGRAVLFLVSWVLLSVCIYLADLASYLGQHPSSDAAGLGKSFYLLASGLLLVAALLCFTLAWRRRR
jgi:hypothetical protein